MRNSIPLAITISASLLIAACSTVEEGTDGISIRHSAKNDLLVQQQADRYCRNLNGTQAIRVQNMPTDSFFWFGTVTSVFKCANPPQG